MEKYHIKQKLYKTSKTGKTQITIHYKNRLIASIKFFDLNQPAFYILYLNVKDSYMNKGIGSYLVKESLRQAKNKGCTAVSLYVKTNNDQAIKFYKRLGFFICQINAQEIKCGPHYLMVREL